MTNKALPYMSPHPDRDFPRLLMANGVTNPKCKGMGVGAPAARRPRCSFGLPLILRRWPTCSRRSCENMWGSPSGPGGPCKPSLLAWGTKSPDGNSFAGCPTLLALFARGTGSPPVPIFCRRRLPPANPSSSQVCGIVLRSAGTQNRDSIAGK